MSHPLLLWRRLCGGLQELALDALEHLRNAKCGRQVFPLALYRSRQALCHDVMLA